MEESFVSPGPTLEQIFDFGAAKGS